MGSIDYLSKPPIHFFMGFDISNLGFTTVLDNCLLRDIHKCHQTTMQRHEQGLEKKIAHVTQKMFYNLTMNNNICCQQTLERGI